MNDYPNYSSGFEYIFFSPVFKSISKADYFPQQNIQFIKNQIQFINPNNLIALGGITRDNFQLALDAGFNGVALLGAIWKNKNPVGYFSEFLNAFNEASK